MRHLAAFWQSRRLRGQMLALMGIGCVSAVGVGYGLRQERAVKVPLHSVYSSEGYGGYVGKSAPLVFPSDAVQPVREAYLAGHYAEVVEKAEETFHRYAGSTKPQELKEMALARRLEAYATARQGNYPRARDLFGYLQAEASRLPDKGKLPSLNGTPEPTLEEEGAFQKIVCRGGSGDKVGAEEEYKQFLREYPQSILVHAAVKRVRRFHNGDSPAEVEALWKQAMQAQAKQRQVEQRAASLCGPKCVAELLRRQGKRVDIEALAKAMGTDSAGSSVAGVAKVAHAQGFRGEGVKMTSAGLSQQKTPFLALIMPGHYVVVETHSPEGVTLWDPNAEALGQPAKRTVTLAEWKRLWDGVAILL